MTNYRIVYEDPLTEEPAKIVVPAPGFIELALAGGQLPSLEAVLADKKFESDWSQQNPGVPFSWLDHGGASQWTADREGPMTEEEAVEYIAAKDIPDHVWEYHRRANRPYIIITTVDRLPATRDWRDAWRLA